MDTKKMRECSSLLPDPGGEVVRKCLDEIERLTAHILELENELAAGVHTCGPTCRKTPVCAELANLAGKMISSAKVQVEYFALRKESPRIKFLEVAE